jgi:hypothetical protein
VHRYELIRDGQLLETEWEELNVRMYEPAEFHALLADSGFTDIRQLDAAGQSAPGDHAMIFDCRRP